MMMMNAELEVLGKVAAVDSFVLRHGPTTGTPGPVFRVMQHADISSEAVHKRVDALVACTLPRMPACLFRRPPPPVVPRLSNLADHAAAAAPCHEEAEKDEAAPAAKRMRSESRTARRVRARDAGADDSTSADETQHSDGDSSCA